MGSENDKLIYFVRHGESVANASGTHQDHTPMLSEKGRRQAEFVAQRMVHTPIEIIIASPMVRALETARAIEKATGKPLEENELFVEQRNPSALFGVRHSEPLSSQTLDLMWQNLGVPQWRHSDEENFDDLFERAQSCLNLLSARPEKHIAVVTHGNLLKMIVTVILTEGVRDPNPFRYLKRTFAVHNTGVTLCRYRPGEEYFPAWRVITWNDSAHLAEA